MEWQSEEGKRASLAWRDSETGMDVIWNIPI